MVGVLNQSIFFQLVKTIDRVPFLFFFHGKIKPNFVIYMGVLGLGLP